MAEKRIGVTLTADPTSLQVGLRRGTSATQDFAQSTEQSMGRTRTAMGGVTQGAEQVADAHLKMSAAQRAQMAAGEAFVRDLERQVAMLGKTQAELLALRAAQLGVTDRAAPLISQLGRTSNALQLTGLSAGQAAMAMRQLPMQITDIVTSLVSGMPVYMVAVQQGGQLRDVFGGFGNVLRGITSLINPMTLAIGAGAVAVGSIALAYYQGSQESERFRESLILSGNAAGLTAGQLQDMAARIGSTVGTQRQAAAVLADVARTSRLGAEDLETFTTAAIRWEEVTGTAAAETVAQFVELGKSPVEASLKLNESLGHLTVATLKQMQSMEEAGRKTEAGKIAQQEFAEAINTRTPMLVENIGYIETAWNNVAAAVKGAWSFALGIGREDSLNEELANARRTLSNLRGMLDDAGEGSSQWENRDRIQKRIDDQIALIAAIEQRAAAEAGAAEAARAEQEALVRQLALDKYTGSASRMTAAGQLAAALEKERAEFREAVKGFAEDSAEYKTALASLATAEENIRKRFQQGGGGVTGGTANELANIRGAIAMAKELGVALDAQYDALQRGDNAAAMMLGSQQALAVVTEKLKVATDGKVKSGLLSVKALLEEQVAIDLVNEGKKERNKLLEEEQKEEERAIEARERAIISINGRAQSLEDEIATYGHGKSAVEQMALSRLREARAIAVADGASKAHIELIDREIEARERLATAMGNKEVLDANKRAADEAARTWERVANQVGQSLTDAIFNGGKSGKELLESLFRTMVLRPVVEPVISGGVNAVVRSLGLGGGANSMPGGFGGGSLSGSLSQGIDWLGERFGSTAVKSFASGMQGIGPGAVATVDLVNGSVTGGASGSAAAGATFAQGLDFAGQALGYGKALYDLTQGNYGAAAGAAIGTYILPGIGTAIGSMLGGILDESFKGETRFGGSFMLDGGRGVQTGGPSGGADGAALQFAQGLLTSTTDLLQRAFASAGVAAQLSNLTVAFESSEKGRGGAYSFGDLTIGGETVRFGAEGKGAGHGGTSGTIEEMMRNAEVDVWQTVIQGWQAAIDQFPPILQDMIRNVDADALGLEAAQTLAQAFVATAEQANALATALDGLPFVPATAATFEYAAALAKATGGAENAATLLASFTQNYYTEAERAAWLTESLTERFAELGFTLPKTREEFRGLIEANLALGEAGAQTVAKLLGMESALSSLLPAFDDASTGLDALTRQMREYDQAIWNSAVNAAQAAMNAVNASIAADRQAAQAAHQTAMDGYRIGLEAAQAAVADLSTLSDTLGGALNAMRLQAMAYDELRLAGAQAQISDALALARAGGSLRGLDISDALAEVGRMDARLYATWEDYASDWMRTANEVAELQGLTDAQLSVEERIASGIERQMELAEAAHEQAMAELDAIQAEMQKQLNELLGINESVMPLPLALAALTQALLALGATPRPVDEPTTTPSSSDIASNWYTGALGRPGESAGVAHWAAEIDRLGAAAAYDAFRHSAYSAGEIPRFARGGIASGWAIVGEEGRELVNFSQPGRVYSASQTARMLDPSANDWSGQSGGGMERLINGLMHRMDALTQEVVNVRTVNEAMAVRLASLEKNFRRVQTEGGNAIRTKEEVA